MLRRAACPGRGMSWQNRVYDTTFNEDDVFPKAKAGTAYLSRLNVSVSMSEQLMSHASEARSFFVTQERSSTPHTELC